MIQRLNPSLSFGASEMNSARDIYSAKMDENSQIVQKQNTLALNTASAQANKSIPMQGVGQKLDVVA